MEMFGGFECLKACWQVRDDSVGWLSSTGTELSQPTAMTIC